MTYNLEQLGPIGFQDLAAALVLKVFGPGVQVMGAGRDGGRDLYNQGRFIWADDAGHPAETWDGYTVVQVKHKARISNLPRDNAAWLWQQVRSELDEWSSLKSSRDPVPKNILVISNVALTPVPTTGGHDLINENIRQYIAADNSRDVGSGAERIARLARISTLENWRFWDANQIQSLLAIHDEVRRSFPGFLTAQDVFAHLADFTDALPLGELEPGLRAHARKSLIGEGLIYFDEAGGADGLGIPVHDVAIDLPITIGSGENREGLIEYVLDRGEHVLLPRLGSYDGPHHLIVAGAPGNGKTTLSRFLVQVYRAALLNGASDLSVDHTNVIAGTIAALRRLNRELPAHRRWPMRIDLAEYAQKYGFELDASLIRWIANRVSRRSDLGTVTARALVSWMKQWPWFLVFDGLDEVTEPTVRRELIARITELVTEAEATNCDLFVVVTTRPMGYAEKIAPTQFERVDLDSLEPDEALRYGKLVTRVRLGSDVDRIDRIEQQLTRAAEDESLANLLRTPLQVLIMTIILGASGQLAPDRFTLFWRYYEIVFNREREKYADFRPVLQDHAQQIQRLHERVGFELQVRSETGKGSMATLTATELRDLTWQVLEAGGFKPSGQDAGLLAKILYAATKRLVLLAPHSDEGYGFDVRSLQELMAGRFLATGRPEAVADRLLRAAPNPHWRNSWIFAAGLIFSTPQDHEHEALVQLVEAVDVGSSERLGAVVPVGPRLALDLIDDGMARALPRWRDRLLSHGFAALNEPVPQDLLNIARVLTRYADAGEGQRRDVASGIRAGLSRSRISRETTKALQAMIETLVDEKRVRTDVRGLSAVRSAPSAVLPIESEGVWDDFDELIASTAPSGGSAELLRQVRATVGVLRAEGAIDDDSTLLLWDALADANVAPVLEMGLAHVVSGEPNLWRLIRDDLLPPLHREAIGDDLRL